MNTFKGANLEFSNLGIHFLLSEIMTFRKQLVVRPEFQSQSGWNNALNAYMVENLEALRDTVENVVYNPGDKTLKELKGDVADTTRSLADDYDKDSVLTDTVVGPARPSRPVAYDLSGSDPDIPQLTPANCPNSFGRGFVTGLDDLFVVLTRLDSRFEGNIISKNEALIAVASLNELYTVCQRKGGEFKKMDIPTGTLPSQEPKTFQGS